MKRSLPEKIPLNPKAKLLKIDIVIERVLDAFPFPWTRPLANVFIIDCKSLGHVYIFNGNVEFKLLASTFSVYELIQYKDQGYITKGPLELMFEKTADTYRILRCGIYLDKLGKTYQNWFRRKYRNLHVRSMLETYLRQKSITYFPLMNGAYSICPDTFLPPVHFDPPISSFSHMNGDTRQVLSFMDLNVTVSDMYDLCNGGYNSKYFSETNTFQLFFESFNVTIHLTLGTTSIAAVTDMYVFPDEDVEEFLSDVKNFSSNVQNHGTSENA